MKTFTCLFALLCTVGVAEAVDGRTVMLWVYRHDNDTQQWQGMVDQITAHKANLTHIAMCTHRILNNGTFGFQSNNGVQYGRAMEYWANVIHAKVPEFVMTPLIDVDYKSWQDIYAFMGDEQKVNQFITDAVAMAKQNGYSGYNMDLEFGGTPPSFGVRYTQFLDKFADGLHQHNMTLTDAISGYCPPWFNGQTCEQQATSKLDKVYTMNTYQEGLNLFKSYVEQGKKTFGTKYAVGMDNTQDPMNLHSEDAMNFAVQHGVKDLALWVLSAPYAAGTTVWSDIGYFLHYAQ